MGLIGQGAGTALDLYSIYQGGQQAKAAGDTNAQIMDMNAKRAGQDAKYANIVTDIKLKNFFRDQAQAASTKRVAAAASGVESGSGTMAEGRASDYQQTLEDAQTIRMEGEQEVRDAEFRQASFKNRAAIAEWKGDSAEKEAYWNMGSTLIGSGLEMYKGYNKAKDRGVNPWTGRRA